MPPSPSENFANNELIFERLFASGIEKFVHPTGMIGYKIVPAIEEANLDPYYSSPFSQRAKNSGDFTIFLGDSPETASLEIFGNDKFAGAPKDTWCLSYKYQGNVLNIETTPPEFKAQFLQWSGDAKHQFSQDFKYYLQQKNYDTRCDSIGWQSVSGERVGVPGFIIAWHSGVSGEFKFQDRTRIA